MISIYLSMLETDDEKDRFEQLYRKYRQDMYWVAFDILKNKEDAEDAVHQSFLKIAKKFSKISQIPCHEIKAYIVIVCRNTSINLYRKNALHAERTVQINEDDIVDESYFEEKDYEELLAAIKQLPQIYKDVIYLYSLQELTAKETASLLGISPELVRKRVSRAKSILKNILEGVSSDE